MKKLNLNNVENWFEIADDNTRTEAKAELDYKGHTFSVVLYNEPDDIYDMWAEEGYDDKALRRIIAENGYPCIDYGFEVTAMDGNVQDEHVGISETRYVGKDYRLSEITKENIEELLDNYINKHLNESEAEKSLDLNNVKDWFVDNKVVKGKLTYMDHKFTLTVSAKGNKAYNEWAKSSFDVDNYYDIENDFGEPSCEFSVEVNSMDNKIQTEYEGIDKTFEPRNQSRKSVITKHDVEVFLEKYISKYLNESKIETVYDKFLM